MNRTVYKFNSFTAKCNKFYMYFIFLLILYENKFNIIKLVNSDKLKLQ